MSTSASAPPASVGARIVPEPVASVRPLSSADAERVLRERGTMLGEPLSLCASAVAAGGCATVSYAFYGDPSTRHLDAVWMAYAPRPGAENEPRRISLSPFTSPPLAARFLGARVHGDMVLALLESEALGPQPAGLRGILPLDDESDANGAKLVGPSPWGEPGEVLARPVIEPDQHPLFGGRQQAALSPQGDSPLPPAALASELASWVEPSGLAVEEVWQGVFRRETERIAPGALARWPQRDALLRALWNAPGEGGFWVMRQKDTGHRDLADGSPWSGGVDFAGTPEHPTVRSVSRYRQVWTQDRRGHRSAPHVVEPGGSREELEAYLARQPVSARLVGHAPLGPAGGTVGLFAPGPGAAHGLLVTFAEGGRGAVFDPWKHLGLPMAGASRVEARFLESSDGLLHLLVRVEWPDRLPWASVARVHQPLQGGGVDVDESDGLLTNRAATIDEALAQVLRAPPPSHDPGEAKEVARVLAASSTREGFLAHSAADAVVFSFRGQDTFADRSAFVSREVLTDKDVRWLYQARSCGAFRRGVHLLILCTGNQPAHRVWMVREHGQLRIAGAARHLDR